MNMETEEVEMGKTVMCMLTDPEGTPLASAMYIPQNTGPLQLTHLVNKFLDNEEMLPYSFYVSDEELLVPVGTYLEKNKVSVEKVLTIVYQQQAVFRIRPVNRCSQTIAGHAEAVLCVSFSPDGKQLASGSGDTTVRLWDLNTETPLFTCKGHKNWVLSVAWSPDGKHLVSGGKAGEICCWNPKKGELDGNPLTGHKKWITGISWEPVHLSSPCRRFVTSSKDGDARIWDFTLKKSINCLSGHTLAVTCVKWGGDGIIYTGSQDCTIKMWETTQGKLIRELKGHGHWVNSLALSTEYVLRTGAFDHTGRQYPPNEEMKKALERYKQTKGDSPERLVSGSDDFTMFLWEPSVSKQPKKRLTGHQQLVNHVYFSPDGKWIASASFDRSVRLWNGITGQFVTAFRGHVGPVYQISWSADSRLLLSGSKDSTLKIWEIRTKKLKQDLPGHADEVFAVDWSPDGEKVVSGGRLQSLSKNTNTHSHLILHLLPPLPRVSKMASTVGVPSLYQVPHLEISKPNSKKRSGCLALSLDKPFFSPMYLRRTRLIHSSSTSSSLLIRSAVATPNSVLSEEAFKSLGLSDHNEFDLDADNLPSDDAEELAISKLGLPQRLGEALEKRGITHLFPIQRAVLVPALEGRDIIARAKTGTGKTLAFGIPIIKRLTEQAGDYTDFRRSGRLPKFLVLAPTRELAKQVEKEIKESAPYLSTVCVYGGVSYTIQQSALTRGVDVVVGTPGRIIDLIEGRSLKLGEVEYLVLDEADQMLAVGFEEAVESILENLPTKRQSMLFSATMPTWVRKLARKYLDNPLNIDLVGDNDEKLAEGIKLYAISATSTSKRTILNDLITVYARGGKTIVFTQTKRDADEVSLALSNSIPTEALHGDISQHQRERTLNGFRQGKFTVLVATDVASRGLDIPNVDLVIHYELPNDAETFVHRSGRTGRAGKQGSAILMHSSSQKRTVRSLERDVGCSFEFISPPTVAEMLEASADQVVATLNGVHPESIKFFSATAQKLIEEKGTDALAAALAHLSGFSQPPSSRSLLSHEKGWVTLQLIRDPTTSRGFLSARSVTGFLSDVYRPAADQVGKIFLIADDRVQGAVFDLPEDIAKALLEKEVPEGNSLSMISKLPPLQDDGPSSDNYGRFSSRDRMPRGGGGSRGSRFGGRGGSSRGRDSWGGDDDRGSRSSSGGGSSWSRGGGSRGSSDDWLIGGGGNRRSSSSRAPSRDRSFGGTCFICGQSGHRASDCPAKRGF